MSLKQSSKEPANTQSSASNRLPTCWSRERDRNCLRIETRNGEAFILPYQHFVGAHFQRRGDSEVLYITFSSHHLRLEGRRLEEIVTALQEYAVDWIAPMPTGYESLREGGSATIITLEVKAVE